MIDITRPIHPNMAVYPGNPAVAFETVSEATLAASALTKITIGSHTGTHIDAPSHIKAGAAGSDSYPLQQMNGPAQVIDLSTVSREILGADLPATTAERVLIKTSNSAGDPDVFDPEFVALVDSAALELVRRQIKLVGIDAPSIKKKGARDDVHRLLLDAGIVILEGLWLANVAAGDYELLCLPLALQGLDGAPVRAVLRR